MLCNMAHLRGGQGRSEPMLAAFHRAEALAADDRKRGMVRGRMDDLARQLIEKEVYDRPLMLWKQCLRIKEALGNPAGVVATKFNMGQLLLRACL